MIGRTVLVATLVILLAGCATTPRPLSVVRVDAEHLLTQHADGSEAPAYEIESRDGLILDATGFKFAAATDTDHSVPTVIQLIVGQRGLYAAPWQAGIAQYSLTASTLVMKAGSGPFRGFRRGDRLILAVGHETVAPPAQSDFYLLWAGAVNVR